MAKQYDLTAVGVNPAKDRAHRMRVYFIMMTIRVACVASLAFVRGWWVILVGVGAIVLPYLAVLFANERDATAQAKPEAPTPLEVEGAHSSEQDQREHSDDSDAAAQTLLVFDAPAERRSSGRGEPETEDAPDGNSTGEQSTGNGEQNDWSAA